MQTEKNIWLRMLSMILTLALLISCIPNQVYAMAGEALAELMEQEETAETIETPNKTKRGVYEATERREANVKHFALEDGTYTAVMYGSAVHTQDAEGNWQDIDNRLSDSGSEFSTSNARIKFAKKITGNETLFTLHDGNRKITMSLNNAIKKTVGAVTNHTTEFDSEATQLQKLMTLDNLSSEILYVDILDGVDLQYVVESLNVKENIIVKERKDSYQYTFTVALNNLEAEMAEDGSVRIYDPGTRKTVYNIPAGFMYDANGEYSPAVVYTLTTGGNGKYSLTVTADATWINAEERAFPVVIDPTVSPGNSASNYNATYISVKNATTNTSNAGYYEAGTKSITFWRMLTLPTLPAGYYITNASFIADKHSSNVSNSYALSLGVYKVISDWNLDTFSYMQYANNNIGECVEYAVDAKEGTNHDGQYIWNITQIVREWYDQPTSNYGIAIRSTNTSTSNNYYRFTLGGKALPIRITYQSMRGLEDYWSYATQNVGRAGTGYVNKATGELTFTIGAISAADTLFGHTTALVYNQAFAGQYVKRNNNSNIPFVNEASGYGWKLNINESLIFKSYVNETDDVTTYYIWTDADGTEHEFYPVAGTANTYKDNDGMQLTLTNLGSGVFEMVDTNHIIRTFSRDSVTRENVTGGYVLESITDRNGNQLIYSYMENGKVEYIQILPKNSTLITQLKFSYGNSGLISSIKMVGSDDAPEVKFYYSSGYSTTTNISQNYSGYLKKIEYLNEGQVVATASYEYDSSGKLIVARDDTSGYYVKYFYTGNKVTFIREFAHSDIDFGQGLSLTYEDGYTEIRSSGNNEDTGTDDDLITVYIFDDYGRVISTYSTDAFRTKIYGASSGEYETQENVKNNIKSSMTVGGAASSYIVNGGFEYITNGTADSWYKSGSVTFSPITSSADKEHDNYCAKFPLSQNSTHELTQRVFLPAGSYTLSLDILADNAFDLDAYIVAESVNSPVHFFSTQIPTDEGEVITSWTNLSMTFDVINYNSTGGDIFDISIMANCASYPAGETGNILIDNVMLEKSVGQSGYSMVEFGNFEDYSVTWGNVTKKSYANYWLTPFSVVYENTLLGKVLKVDPSTAYTSVAATQTIYWNAHDNDSNIPKSFIISGMAKGTQQYASGDFCVNMSIFYEDGDYEPQRLEFQNDCTTWQFASMAFTTSGKAISMIVLEIIYNNPGIAYFDNIYVTQVMADLVTNTEYNEEGQLIEYNNGSNQDLYAYDDNGNVTLHLHNNSELYRYTYDNFNHILTEECLYLLDCVYNKETGTISFSRETVEYTKIYEYTPFGQLKQLDFYDGRVAYEDTKDTTPRVSENYFYEETPGSHIFGTLSQSRPNPREQIIYERNPTTGQLIAEIRPRSGDGTCYGYNLDGSLATVMPVSCTNAVDWAAITNTQHVTYDYYDTGLLESITTESTTYNFSYDVFGNTTSVEAGVQELASYEYNPFNGKLHYLHYANGTTVEYVYDELERVAEIWYTINGSRTQAYAYKYNAYGQLYRFDNLMSGKTLIYQYDGNRRMTGYAEFNTSDMSAELSAAIQYNEKSQIETVSYSFDYVFSSNNTAAAHNLEYVYTYGDNDAVTELELKTENKTHSFKYEYNDYGWAEWKTYDSKTGFKNTVQYTYYAHLLEQYPWVEYYRSTVTNTDNNTTSSYTYYHYDYDNNGNITKINLGLYKEYRYVYDDIGQLVREDNTFLNETYVYEYDNAGNITKKYTYTLTTEGITPTNLKSTYVYSYGDTNWGDKLTAYRGVSFTYDEIGNPLTYYNGRSYTFTWEYGRRLATAMVGTTELEFTYNDEGIRTSKTVNGVKHTYRLNGSQIVSEAWGNHLLIYLYDAEGAPVGMMYRNSTYPSDTFDTFWFEKNLQGDIVAVYDEDGTKLISYTYDAWGNFATTYHNDCTASDPANFNPYRYRSYYYDAETGLYYLQSRYYDPVIGRFINADKYVSTGQGILSNNMFAYCVNNPVNRIDKTGTSFEDLWDAVVEWVDTGMWALEEIYYVFEEAFLEKVDLCIDEPFNIVSHAHHCIDFWEDIYWCVDEIKQGTKDTVFHEVQKKSLANGLGGLAGGVAVGFALGTIFAPETGGLSYTLLVNVGLSGFLSGYVGTAVYEVAMIIFE